MQRSSSQPRLSHLQRKISTAFGHSTQRPSSTEEAHTLKSRSQSQKSLATSRNVSAHKQVPFSAAIKKGLVQGRRKSLVAPFVLLENISEPSTEPFEKRKIVKRYLKPKISCDKSFKGQPIKGYAWFHQKELPVVTVCKNTGGNTLRYFAIKEQDKSKSGKKVLAAIQDSFVYAGSKGYLLISPSSDRQEPKPEASKLSLKQHQIVVVVDEKVKEFCNFHNLLAEINDLLKDGVGSLDAIAKIMGRRLVKLKEKSERVEVEIFVLLLLGQGQQ